MKPVREDRVALYVRWSTDDQSEGTTLQVQLEGCRHFALSQGWTPQAELTFIDDGYSGATLDRPALRRLRDLVARGEIDCVIVFKVDRLSRNIVDAVDLVLGEWRDTCYFKSAREPIDSSTDLGRMIFSVL
ncbi:MAG TPA: recombinase family protein, partial [Symbiobacteriaceae bacterium]|nr:recombinase family protein [Symbiobacteriaceae bacterium]